MNIQFFKKRSKITKNTFSFFIIILNIFVIACSDNDSSTGSSATTAAVTPGIKIVNISDNVSTSDLTTWTTDAAAKMSSQVANVLFVSWDIGAYVADGTPFNTHTVVITSEQIETLMTEIDTWLKTTCSTSVAEESATYRAYITNGSEVSSQFAICGQYRLILIGVIQGSSSDNSKNLAIHELYHALQQDLGDEDCNTKREITGSNGKGWINEGAADYFSNIEMYGSSAGVQKILELGLEAYNEDSSAAITGTGVASRGSAGLRLMVKRGALTESNILDGSLFHSCATESDYTDSNSNIVSAEANWYKIQLSSGVYSFTSAALQ
jgi:hypothetical protein